MAGKDAEALLKTAGRRVLDRQHISASWREAGAKLKALARSASPRTDPSAIEPSIAYEMRTRYTMDEERRIHAKFFGESHSTVDPASKLTHAEDLEDMFF